MDDFGIIIACSDQSYLFVKGCCAAIRHFLGDVPICVIVDGSFSTADLRNTYGVRVLDHGNVESSVLRARGFGWGITKMIAFWESPWRRFLCLDPDTLVWGDVLRFAGFDRADVVLDQQFAKDGGRIVNPLLYDFLHMPRPDAALRKSVVDYCIFDTAQVERWFPAFDWRAHLYGYSWTGVFFAKRGLFSLEEYVELLDFADEHPDVFLGGEMGLLNFLVFRAAQAGRLRVDNVPMQVLVCEEDQRALAERFALADGALPRTTSEAAVLHWTGAEKPSLACADYAAPMTAARRTFCRDAGLRDETEIDAVLRREDVERLILRKRYLAVEPRRLSERV